MITGEKVKVEDLVTLCSLPTRKHTSKKFYSVLRTQMLMMTMEPMITLLTLHNSQPLDELFNQVEREPDSLNVGGGWGHSVM